MIKEYFLNYYLYNSDLTIELDKNSVQVHLTDTESFKVTLIDTGLNTNTAGRIKRIKKYVSDETFMLTYGDGLSNVNLYELLKFHRSHSKLATLTTVQLSGRFGKLETDIDGSVLNFQEKPEYDGSWINAGFFVLEPGIFDFLSGEMDEIQWEKQPLLEIAQAGQLSAFKHLGFWKPMDALRDRIELENLWVSENCPWKIW